MYETADDLITRLRRSRARHQERVEQIDEAIGGP